MKRSLLKLVALAAIVATLASACATPTPAPTPVPPTATIAPTKAPVVEPTKPPAAPTAAPTAAMPAPTVAPTMAPTVASTKPAVPTVAPSGPACVKTGGTYKWNYSLPADRFGVPQNVVAYNHVYTSLSLEPLIAQSNTEAGVFTPKLAVAWELAADKLSYTFKLRQGVKFTDGSDFNAEVAKWNIDRWIAAKTPTMRTVTNVVIVDPYTIKVNLSTWDATGLDDFNRAGWMMSKKSFDEKGEAWMNNNPVGTGPWKLVSFEPKQLLKYVKNPDYWDKGFPCFDAMEITQVPDPMTAIAMIKKGDVNALYQTDMVTASDLKKSNPTYQVSSFVGPHFTLAFNNSDPASIWSNIKMRQALEYAIDKESIVKAIGYGYYKAYYEIIHSINEAGGTPGTTPRKYDVAKAKALIAEAGVKTPINVKLTYGSIWPADGFVAIQRNLADVGIIATLNPVDNATLNQMSFEPTKGSDLRVQEQRGGTLAPLGSSKETLLSNGIYYPGIKRPAGFEDLINQALAEPDAKKQLDLLSKAEKLVYDDVFFVPLWNNAIVTVDDGKVKNMIWAFGGIPSPRFNWASLP